MRGVGHETPYPEEGPTNVIRIEKDDLIKQLEENKKNHRAIFEEALEGYRQAIQEALEAQLKTLSAGKIPDIKHLPIPQDHTRDYERIIKMVQMTVSPIVELSEQEIAWYVMDDWAWKQQFMTTSAAYLAQS